MTGLLVPCDIAAPLEAREIGSFAEIQEPVAQLVIPVDVEPAGVTMFVDAHDRSKSPQMNTRASFFGWLWDSSSRQMPALHGDLLLFGMPNQLSQVTDVPKDLLTEILHGGPYQVELKLTTTRRISIRHGESNVWKRLEAVHSDYSDAAIWCMLSLTRTEGAEGVRMVPVPVSSGVGPDGEQAA